MKRILLFILIAFLLPMCRTHRHVQRVKSYEKIDSVFTSQVEKIKTNNSTIKKATQTNAKVKENYENVVIKEVTKDAEIEGYTITSNFYIDTAARGDTIRMLSHDDDRMSVSIFYDKKTKQAVAQITNKKQVVKVPFREVTITNRQTEESMKTIDTSRYDKNFVSSYLSKDSAKFNKELKIESKNKDVKRTGLKWYWWVIATVGIIVWLVIKFKIKK